jgi:hypothetical protein
VVGHGNRWHITGLGLGNQVIDTASAVEKAVLGMDVEVDERLRHIKEKAEMLER